jgi:uncharacterized protein (DUF1499 family)
MTNSSATLATLAVLSIIVSSLGTRGRWFHFRVGLALFALAGLFGGLALLLGAFAWYRGSALGAVAAIVGGLVMLVPAYGIAGAVGKPMIHDITTDLDDPPRFETLKVAPYDPANASIQRAAYADVQPLTLAVPPADAFERARAAAATKWEIASSRPEAGILEATATTGFFGFKDDVIVRVRPDAKGSRIDVRSVSRVGKSDVGMNAKRIREYLGTIRE